MYLNSLYNNFKFNSLTLFVKGKIEKIYLWYHNQNEDRCKLHIKTIQMFKKLFCILEKF